MTRDEFTTGLVQRLRNVRQKEQRLRIAHETLRVLGSVPSREAAYAEAATNLDAADNEFADFIFDALEAVESSSPSESL